MRRLLRRQLPLSRFNSGVLLLFRNFYGLAITVIGGLAQLEETQLSLGCDSLFYCNLLFALMTHALRDSSIPAPLIHARSTADANSHRAGSGATMSPKVTDERNENRPLYSSMRSSARKMK
ncbi:hypothetical protein DNTS_023741 [Danionella cerebrum]|uniref:Uncharacterized protein n=1 Tax=Danionella cerebrum TaxID=2873325 RepID=A0A553QP80_9TELE|nr:hypothetical protein DNTS_023741 [Danionella translucida]